MGYVCVVVVLARIVGVVELQSYPREKARRILISGCPFSGILL